MTELTAAGARELAAALLRAADAYDGVPRRALGDLELLRLVDGRRLSVALSESATCVAPSPAVPQGLCRRHGLSCREHQR